MENWLAEYAEMGWRDAHVRFEHIHPFVDGNGRLGRMLMNWQRKQEGLDILVIEDAKKHEYYEWFK
jgi:fido (protein-threonine AMPylation protein)